MRLTVNLRSKPVGYHPVAPLLVVVELRADIATDDDRRCRHAVRMFHLRNLAP